MATTEIAPQQLLIGGEWAEAGSGRTYEQAFPFTGEAVGHAASCAGITVQDLPRQYPI